MHNGEGYRSKEDGREACRNPTLAAGVLVLLRRLLGFHVFIFVGSSSASDSPEPGRMESSIALQAIIFHLKEKIPAVILGKLTGYP